MQHLWGGGITYQGEMYGVALVSPFIDLT